MFATIDEKMISLHMLVKKGVMKSYVKEVNAWFKQVYCLFCGFYLVQTIAGSFLAADFALLAIETRSFSDLKEPKSWGLSAPIDIGSSG